MPSTFHELLREMFRIRPELAAELLSGLLGVGVPVHEQARVEAADCTDVLPTEFHADAVVVLSNADGPVLAVVIEVQRGYDPDKQWSWPVYLATLRARWRCPAELLVVCPKASVAARYAEPIMLGLRESRVVPRVLGPDLIPVVSDSEQAAREPELAVLSAMAHGGDPARRNVLDAMFDGLTTVDKNHRFLYLELVYRAMPAAAQSHLRGLIMSIDVDEDRSDFKQWLEAIAEQFVEARASVRAVLAVLEARGVDVPEEAKQRIRKCRDLDQLDIWVRQAVTARTIDDLFD